jgi:MoaA/NifB/PqqE/SkfB family radical SAM enzyme
VEALRPKLAWLTVNHQCNLHCKWCYQRKLGGKGKAMPKELAKELVDLLAEMGLENIILIGGEPTLWSHFFPLIEYIKGKKLRITIVTNAILFAHDEFTDKASQLGVDDITTSLKGASEEEYGKFCGFGHGFEMAKRAIGNIEKSPMKQKVSITVSRSIISNWQRMVEFIATSKAHKFSISFEKPTILPGGIVSFDNRMMPGKIAEFVRKVMYPSLVKTGKEFRMEFMSPHCHFPDEFIEQVESEGHAFGGMFIVKKQGDCFRS